MTVKEKIAWAAAAAIAPIMVVILTQMGETPEPAVKLDHMNSAQKDSVVAHEIRTAAKGKEIVSLRKLNSRVVKVDEGKFQATISTLPMNYLDDADSTYKPIDLTPKDVHELAKNDPLRKFDKYIFAGNYRAGWYKQKPHDVSLYKDEYSISYTALFDTTEIPTKTEYRTDGVKQTYTFTDAGSVQDLKWLMSSNTIKQKAEDGSITFADSIGKILFVSPAPTAWDARYIPILVTVTISGDTLIYVTNIPENAVYPITVDPTTVMYNVPDINHYAGYYGADATYLIARNADTADAPVGPSVGQTYSAPDYYIRRSYFLFETSGIPDGAVPTSATLCLGVLTTDSDDTGFNVHLVNGTMSGTPATTWYNDFDNWASSGTYSVTNLMTPVASSTWAVNDSVKFTLNAAGLAAISLTDTTKYAVLSSRDITPTTPTGYEYLTFETPAGYYLQVTYSLPPIAPTDFANTGATTTTLSYSWADASSDELGFKIKNAGGDTITVATSAAGAVADTVEGLGINTRHGLRVFAFNAEGWSVPSDSVVTYTLANPPTSWNFTNVGVTGTVDVGFNANSNPATTQFAVRDSTNQQWVQTDGTLGASIDWDTYAVWDAVTITDPGVTGTVRYSVMARNGDNVNTAEITGTLYVYKFPSPTVDITTPTPTSLKISWTGASATSDSLLIMNDPEHTAVAYVSVVAADDTTITGLTPNTIYTWFIRADSSGTKGDSNSDSLYTLANPATGWAFTEGTLFHVTPAFTGGTSNPAGTQYAVRDSLRHVWISATGTTSGTKVWQTEAQWEAITISGLQCGRTYKFGVVGKNGDGVETSYVWGNTAMSAAFITSTGLGGGRIFNQNPTYSTARDAASGTIGTSLSVGQDSTTSGYTLYRSWLTFPLPEKMKAVTSCVLSIYGEADHSTTDFEIYVHGANNYRPVLEDADYDVFDGHVAASSDTGAILNTTWDSSTYSATWNSITFGTIGKNRLITYAPDSLALVLISKEDFGNSAPAGVAAISEWGTFANNTNITYAYTPYRPTSLTLSPLATDSLHISWTDNSADEDSFVIHDATTGNWLGAVAAGVQELHLGGLATNSEHNIAVEIKGNSGDGLWSDVDSMYTKAAIPGAISVTYPTSSLIKAVLNTNGNPAWTKIAIQDSISGYYLHLLTGGVADTFRVAPDWETYASWGSAAGCSISVNPGKVYRLRAAARNTAN